MNVLLLYPEFPDTFWSFKHALRFINKEASSPPLGLITVAAMLPEAWNKRLIDLNVRNLKDSDIKWADLVFVSAMIIQKKSTREVFLRCKEQNKKIVAGGPLFTAEYEEFEDLVDHFVLNEAEITLQPFLQDFQNGTAKKLYQTNEFCDIKDSPIPQWNLIDLKKYDSLSIQFSRGCPFNCDFCNITALLGHKPRIKTAQQIINELDLMYSLGWRRNIFFVDDNFIGNKRILKEEILPALIEWHKNKTGCQFITEASVNLADDEELMKLMVEAGFKSVFVGIETPSEEGLTECQKTQNKNRDLVQTVKEMQHAGLQVMGGFIVGFDSDNENIFKRQIEFIQQSGIVTAMVGLLQAPIGTKLYQRLQTEGRIVSDMSGDNADGTTNIIPKMDLVSLKDGYFEILREIYSPKLFYERVANCLASYQPAVQAVQLEANEIYAFFRSIWKLGILGKERKYYWKLFFHTLFHEPKKFPLAITFSIYGYHFRKVFENNIKLENSKS
ncbi:MAG: B12-binding domain-containing radical SAM protein [Anaerolineaceae bacterium]